MPTTDNARNEKSSSPRPPRVLVVHPEQQHSYRLAYALKLHGMLAGYVTTIYNKRGSITGTLLHFLPERLRAKASRRRFEGLDDGDVIQVFEIGGLVQRLFLNVRPLFRWYWKVMRDVEDIFAKRAARIAVEMDVDCVVSFDSCSAVLFERLRDEAPDIVRVIDMSAANSRYLRTVHERDCELKPEFAEKLKSEWRLLWDDENLCRAAREQEAADHFLCPSSFVKRSLEWSGVDSSRCEVSPYGVDTSEFRYVPRETRPKGQPVEFVYVGATNELKGISWLLDACASVPREACHLTIVGTCNLPDDVRRRYEGIVDFAGRRLHDEMPGMLAKADVAVLASLGEGLPLSLIEAMSVGLPVICSENSGITDFVEDGVNGLVVPVQDSGAIARAMTWFFDNRGRIPDMSLAARKTSELLTWERYYERTAELILGFCREKDRARENSR